MIDTNVFLSYKIALHSEVAIKKFRNVLFRHKKMKQFLVYKNCEKKKVINEWEFCITGDDSRLQKLMSHFSRSLFYSQSGIVIAQ